MPVSVYTYVYPISLFHGGGMLLIGQDQNKQCNVWQAPATHTHTALPHTTPTFPLEAGKKRRRTVRAGTSNHLSIAFLPCVMFIFRSFSF